MDTLLIILLALMTVAIPALAETAAAGHIGVVRQPLLALDAAMLQARETVGRRSWSHPQEPTAEDWWADLLADPRVRKGIWRTDMAVR